MLLVVARPGPLRDLPRLLDCSTVRKYFSELRGIVFQLLKASGEKGGGAGLGEKDSSGSFVVLLSLFYVCAAQKEDGGRS